MIHQFGVHLKVRDIGRSFLFYKRFGFDESFGYGEPAFLKTLAASIPKVSEKYNGVVFQIGNALFEIADGHAAVKPEIFQQEVESSKLSAMIYVHSVKKIEVICRKNRVEIASAIKEYPWGTREIVIQDPDGFVLVFIEKIKK